MTLTIYSKPGCHLCDEMKAVVERVLANHLSRAKSGDKGSPHAMSSPHTELEIVDISKDPELDARYGLEIPVLMIDGKKAAKYRVSEEELERRLKGGP